MREELSVREVAVVCMLMQIMWDVKYQVPRKWHIYSVRVEKSKTYCLSIPGNVQLEV